MYCQVGGSAFVPGTEDASTHHQPEDREDAPVDLADEALLLDGSGRECHIVEAGLVEVLDVVLDVGDGE
jgi:hypothetical protein